MKRLVALLIATAASLSGFALSSPAEALPTGCTAKYYPSANWGSSYCSGGTGQHRVRLSCWWNGSFAYRYGAWENPGSYSVASCLGVVGAITQKR